MPLDSTKSISDQIREKQQEFLALEVRWLKSASEGNEEFKAATAAYETAERELAALMQIEKSAAERARPLILQDGRVVTAGGGGATRDDGKAITPDYLIKSAVVAIEASLFRRRIDDVRKERYGDDDQRLLRAMSATVPLFSKAAQGPATTFTPGYAAELVQTTYGAWISMMAPEAIFAQINWNGATFPDRGGKVVFPTRDDSAAYPANLEAMWRKEGDPIRVGRLTTKAVEIQSYGPAVISHFTKELFARSTPNIESVVRQAIVEDSAEAFDLALFGNAAAVADVRPAGLLNGINAGDTRASSGATLALIDSDLMLMIKTMATNKLGRRPWWVMSEANRIALSAKLNPTSDVAPYRAGLSASQPTLLNYPVASSLSFPSNVVYLLDAEAIAFAGGSPQWEVSDQATLHEESQTPLPISTPGAPATVAAPTRSLFQTHSAAVKAVYTIGWGALRSRPIQALTAVAW